MEDYGIYVGKKLSKTSKKSGIPLWRWGLVKRTTSKPSTNDIKEEIRKADAIKGYAMRLNPRPWKKVSQTISLD